LSFDGTDDYVDIKSLNKNIGSAFSVAAWIKTSSGSYQTIAPLGRVSDAPNNLNWGLTIGFLAANKVEAYAQTGGSTWFDATSVTSVNDNKWHHVVGTYDGETVRVYVDGALEDSDTGPNGSVITYSTSASAIGRNEWNPPTSYSPFNGMIDEVQIYKEALILSQIQKLYAQGVLRRLLSLNPL